MQVYVSIAAALGLKASQIKALLKVPATLNKINAWTQARHSETFWHGDANFNTNYRITGWGWVFLTDPFPGTTQFWVEYRPGTPDKDTKRFAVNPSVDFD